MKPVLSSVARFLRVLLVVRSLHLWRSVFWHVLSRQLAVEGSVVKTVVRWSFFTVNYKTTDNSTLLAVCVIVTQEQGE